MYVIVDWDGLCVLGIFRTREMAQAYVDKNELSEDECVIEESEIIDIF